MYLCTPYVYTMCHSVLYVLHHMSVCTLLCALGQDPCKLQATLGKDIVLHLICKLIPSTKKKNTAHKINNRYIGAGMVTYVQVIQNTCRGGWSPFITSILRYAHVQRKTED